MESLSLVVYVDCTENSLATFIGQLLSSLSPHLTYVEEVGPQIFAHRLHLETKYYKADVGLCQLKSRDLVSESFSDRIEAVIINVDSSSPSAADSWLSFINHWEPNVRILVCDQILPETRQTFTTFCVKNEFELVELNPSDECREEAEECGELLGIQRILQILKSHSWSNLTLKDESAEREDRSKRLRELLADSSEFGEFVSSSSVENAESATGENVQKKIDVDLNEASGENNVSATNNGGDAFGNFEELFEKLTIFKSKGESLPDAERKKYAETVTMEFWKAIGGDEDDIDGLSDFDDEDEKN